MRTRDLWSPLGKKPLSRNASVSTKTSSKATYVYIYYNRYVPGIFYRSIRCTIIFEVEDIFSPCSFKMFVHSTAIIVIVYNNIRSTFPINRIKYIIISLRRINLEKRIYIFFFLIIALVVDWARRKWLCPSSFNQIFH